MWSAIAGELLPQLACEQVCEVVGSSRSGEESRYNGSREGGCQWSQGVMSQLVNEFLGGANKAESGRYVCRSRRPAYRPEIQPSPPPKLNLLPQLGVTGGLAISFVNFSGNVSLTSDT